MYKTEDEYINVHLSAIARNSKNDVKKVIEIYETSLRLNKNNKRKALVNTHYYFKKKYYYDSKNINYPYPM